MKLNIIRNLALLTFPVAAVTMQAEVRLPQIFSDGMVVQRNQPIRLWGKADPGETVTAGFKKSKNAKKATNVTVTANENGDWEIMLPEMKAGGPYSLIIGDRTIDNVAVGDVLLCSGQSNMELPVRRVTDMFADEISEYSNPMIRHIKIPNMTGFHGEEFDIAPTKWQDLTPDNVMNFSALAYFTAKELNEKTGLPVGIINSSWGGTPVESWVSEPTLAAKYPYAINQKNIYNNDAYRDLIKKTEGENYTHWNQILYSSDAGCTSDIKWYDPDLDDSDWTTLDMFSNQWNNDGMNPINGSHWFRKTVSVPSSWEGKPATLRLGCIVDADSVYVNGQFVGTTSYQYPPRIYNIPAGVLHEGNNNVTVRIISQGGRPHFVAEKPYKIICGDEELSLEGNWRYRLGTRMPNGPSMMFWCYLPGVLYNAMIAPIIKYPVAAAVWYQGESNVGRSNEYPYLLDLMISDWRQASGDTNMPFYVVELADFLHKTDVGGRKAWAEMRRRQAEACNSIDGATLIPNSDLGEWNDIHPLDKKTLGKRVATAICNDMNE